MLRFRPEQMQALEIDFRKRRRKYLWERFKSTYPELGNGIEDEEGIRIIDECIEDGKGLDITGNDDVLRFSALAFLPQHIRHDAWFASIVIRILHKEDLSAGERLSFLFDNVVDIHKGALRGP